MSSSLSFDSYGSSSFESYASSSNSESESATSPRTYFNLATMNAFSVAQRVQNIFRLTHFPEDIWENLMKYEEFLINVDKIANEDEVDTFLKRAAENFKITHLIQSNDSLPLKAPSIADISPSKTKEINDKSSSTSEDSSENAEDRFPKRPGTRFKLKLDKVEEENQEDREWCL